VNGTPLLSARHVTKTFGVTQALRGVDFEILAGEMVAIMGPSGSGKSTLLHCLAGVLLPDTGEVWFDGRRVDEMPEAERSALRRHSFGFVFQFGQLIPELPAVENVALPLLLDGTGRRAALAAARNALDRLAMGDAAGSLPGRLSGGEAQRVALARALVIRPAVLFADEPTGSLDSLASERVMDLLVDATRDDGTTVVLVTHDARVAAYAAREVVVRDGQTTTSVVSAS
jgi:putative ABC transport system ATP-binding protein